MHFKTAFDIGDFVRVPRKPGFTVRQIRIETLVPSGLALIEYRTVYPGGAAGQWHAEKNLVKATRYPAKGDL